MKKFQRNSVQKILIICLNGLGDVITTTPLIMSVRKEYPRAKIFMLVKNSFMESVFGASASSIIDKFFHFDPGKQSLLSIFKIVNELRSEKIDLSFTATDTDFLKGPILTYMMGINYRVGETPNKNSFYNKVIGYDCPVLANYDQHRVESNLDLCRSISIKSIVRNTYFAIEETNDKTMRNIISMEFESKNHSYCLIHPGCNIMESFRRWPLENYLSVARYVSQKYEFPVIFIGGKDEEDLSSEIDKYEDRYIINAINKLNIGVTASLIRSAKFIIGNDSGLMHIAGVVGTPTVSLIGYEKPIRCAPWGTHNEIVEAPISAKKDRVREIMVDSVLNAVDKIICHFKG
jgi:ADP-heptose:LPS heptosyltransferase